MAADTIPCHWRVPVEFGVYLILALCESQLQLLLASLCIRRDQLGLLLRHGQLVFASLPREYTQLARRHRVRQRPAAAAAKVLGRTCCARDMDNCNSDSRSAHRSSLDLSCARSSVCAASARRSCGTKTRSETEAGCAASRRCGFRVHTTLA